MFVQDSCVCMFHLFSNIVPCSSSFLIKFTPQKPRQVDDLGLSPPRGISSCVPTSWHRSSSAGLNCSIVASTGRRDAVSLVWYSCSTLNSSKRIPINSESHFPYALTRSFDTPFWSSNERYDRPQKGILSCGTPRTAYEKCAGSFVLMAQLKCTVPLCARWADPARQELGLNKCCYYIVQTTFISCLLLHNTTIDRVLRTCF